MRKILREIVIETDTFKGRVFDLFIQFLIVVSLIAFSIDTLPDLSQRTYDFLSLIERFVVAVFTVEYLLRVLLVENRKKYIFSFYGVVDLLAILPFYLPADIGLQTLRILRFLRIFKILRFSKYNSAYSRIVDAIKMAKEELILFSLLTLILLYLSAVGIYHFEHAAQPEVFRSIFDSLWWAVATLTTVGYGDVYPITAGGKVFTFFILMLGLGIIAVPTGILASALASVRKK